VQVRRALSEAKFRAHGVERSTGDIVLPVLLRTNGVAAVAVVLAAVAAALWVFKRSSAVLDALCRHLGAWQEAEAARAHGSGAGPAIVEAGETDPGALGWAEDLGEAFTEADGALWTTYRSVGEGASAVASAAERIETALGKGTSTADLTSDVEAISERTAEMGSRLDRYRSGDGD